MRIELQSKKAKLKTAGKFVEEDIEVAAKLQSKNVTPTESPQIVNTDSGFSGIDKVEVGAIPSNYVGSAITRKGETTYTPTTTDQEIASGQYLSGKQVIKGDSNLTPENIAKGTTIFGVTGTHEGGITPEGTMLIKQNGVYDVTDKAEVDVQVETVTEPTDPPVFGFATFNENGEYSAEDYGVDGWSSVKVEVAGGGSDLFSRYISGDPTLTELTASDFGDITELKKGAFYFNSATYQETPTITKITLPDTIKTISRYCFYRNNTLEEFVSNGATLVDDYGLCSCGNIKKIDIPNVSSLNLQALYGCESLTDLKIGKNDNGYIDCESSSLRNLKSLTNINDGENKLSVITSSMYDNRSDVCSYLCANLEEPVIDVDDYVEFWDTGGGGSGYSYQYAKIKNFTLKSAEQITSSSYGKNMFYNSTITNMYMEKIKKIEEFTNVANILQNANIKRIYMPLITNLSGKFIPATATIEKVIIGNTPTLVSSIMNENTKFYFSYNNISYFSMATNWTTLFTNDTATPETRMFVYGEFNSGDTLPTIKSGYSITWYTDEDFTTEVSGTAPDTATYYGKITFVKAIIEIKGSEAVSTVDLTQTIDCEVGDNLLATFYARGTVTTPSDWTLLYTADELTSPNGTTAQTMYVYTKVAQSTSETFTVTTESGSLKAMYLINIKDCVANVVENLSAKQMYNYNSPITITKPTNNNLLYLFTSLYVRRNSERSWNVGGSYSTYRSIESGANERLGLILSTFASGTSFTLTSLMNWTEEYRYFSTIALELVPQGE